VEKSKGFKRLRLAAASAGAVAASLFGGISRSARAVDTPTPIDVVAAGVNWGDVGNEGSNFSNCTSDGVNGKRPAGPLGGNSSLCLGISEASIVSPSRSDGLDGGLQVGINDFGFINPDGTLDLTGTTVSTNGAPARGGPPVITNVQYFFSPTLPVVRALFSFTNSGQAAFTGTANIASNLGSDNNTIIQATQDGDTTVETTDRWIVTSDNAPTTGDPVLLWIRQGVGAPTGVSATPQVPGAGNDNFQDNYPIDVPAGQTRRIMVFLRLGTDVPTSSAAAPTFDSLTSLNAAGLLSGLSTQEQSEIINWAPAAPTGTSFVSNVPSLSDLGKLTLALILGGAALIALGRRRA
jgi:hypothetical protein